MLKRDGDPNVYARLNQSGKTNLLKHVARPLGGSIDLDYSREGNQVDPALLTDNPRNEWVLSRVSTDDGRSNRYTNTFDYTILGPGVSPRDSSGHYARDEREFYGYGHVMMTRGVKQSDGTFAEGDGSRVDRFFENHSYYLKGLPAGEFESNAFGGIFRGSLHVYAQPGSLPIRTGTFFPGETVTSDLLYEQKGIDLGDALATRSNPTPTGLAPKYKIQRRGYDAEGNLKSLTDEGDEQSSTDDVGYAMVYSDESLTHVTRATSITATQVSTGTVLRQRTAQYDPLVGTLNTLTNFVSGGKVPLSGTPGTVYNQASAIYTFGYDPFGNLKTSKDPTGYQLQYTYDPTTQTYRTATSDSFTLSSSATYDLRFGTVLQSTDVNGQPESFSYDVFGRLCSVRGPDDQPTTTLPTITMSYAIVPTSCPNGPAAGNTFPAYAVTRHKDVQHSGDPIDTVTFIDGLGRVFQTKKDLDRDAAGNGSVQTLMSVSGLVLFDSRGRVASQGQAGVSIEPTTTLALPNISNPTLFGYDQLGRQTSVNAPDGTPQGIQTTTVYGITTNALADGRTWLQTQVTDPLGNNRLAFADSRGNRVGVQEFNVLGTATTPTKLTTTYAYDPLDQLLFVTDANENVTSTAYDTLGQMVTLTSPDAGQTEFRYDLAGNLKEKQTAVLHAASQSIKYNYTFDRLTGITYPTSPAVTYTYGVSTDTGDSHGNVAGRIKQVAFDNGSETRTYDHLGNVKQTQTTLNRMSTTTGLPASMTFTMQYTYDWLGRMQTMTFPNWIDQSYNILAGQGELVTYTYDHGGNLDKITGFDQTANPQQTSTPRNYTYLNHIGYNEFEQRTVLTSGNGIANSYGYDSVTRRLTSVKASANGSLEQQQHLGAVPFHNLQYTYDKVGNVTEMDNNVSVQPGLNAGVFVGPTTVAYQYDNLYQLRSMTAKYRGNVAYGYQYSNAYTYDAIGNMQTKAQSQDRLVWNNQTVNTKDTNPIATQLSGSTFDHNVTGLTFSLGYQYTSGRPHATTPVTETLPNVTPASRTYTYDANGNNTGNTFQQNHRAQTWNEENRLNEVDLNGGMLAKFRYNDQGERTKKQSSAGDAWYVNQYFVLLPNNLPTKHIFAGTERVATKTDAIYMQTPVLDYYHNDHLGTTSYLSVATQDLVQHERYFAFGGLWRPGDEQDETDLPRGTLQRNWLFTGKEWDVDESLYYFGARYFDPHTDAWQSTDPILRNYVGGNPGGGVFRPANLALYSYAWNNPVRNIDPNGTVCQATGASSSCGGGHDDVQGLFAHIDQTLAQADRLVAKWNEELVVSAAERSGAPAWAARDAAFGKVSLGNFHGDQLEQAYAFGTNIAVGLGTAGIFSEGAGLLAPEIGGGGGRFSFSQITASPDFDPEGWFAGKTIGGLSSELRAGTVTTSQVPVRFVIIDGKPLLVNTRSALSLMRAGIPQSQWSTIDVTATQLSKIQLRLMNNGLTSSGTDTLRITGLGQSASSLR